MPKPAWTIKSLWIGDSLSPIEQLALSSFIHHGHSVELFTYGKVRNIPSGVTLRNGEEILAKKKIFMYNKRPSYAAFANWFRYVMLYKEGGVWIDTDVVCLQPFNFQQAIFFGNEQHDKINNAVIGALPNMEIFDFLANQAANPNQFLPFDTIRDKRRKLVRKFLRGNKRGDLKWGETGPIGLTRAINHYNLMENVLPITAFYPIHSSCWTTIFDETYSDPSRYFPDSYAIHLWNEMMRRKPGFNKGKTYAYNSLIEGLKRQYLN